MDPDRATRSDMFPSGIDGMTGTADDLLTLLNTLRGGVGPLMSLKIVAVSSLTAFRIQKTKAAEATRSPPPFIGAIAIISVDPSEYQFKFDAGPSTGALSPCVKVSVSVRDSMPWNHRRDAGACVR